MESLDTGGFVDCLEDSLEAEELSDSLELGFEGSRSLSCPALDSNTGDNDGGFPAMGWTGIHHQIIIIVK